MTVEAPVVTCPGCTEWHGDCSGLLLPCNGNKIWRWVSKFGCFYFRTNDKPEANCVDQQVEVIGTTAGTLFPGISRTIMYALLIKFLPSSISSYPVHMKYCYIYGTHIKAMYRVEEFINQHPETQTFNFLFISIWQFLLTSLYIKITS